MANFDFLMDFEKPVRPHADAIEALKSVAGSKDQLLEVDNARGALNITCNGKGIRRDFAPKSAQGFSEYILLSEDVVLTLVRINPVKPIYHRSDKDPSLALGIQLHGAKEIIPTLHTTQDNIFFCGGMGEESKNERIIVAGECFSAINITTSMGHHEKLLQTHLPAISEILDECVQELDSSNSFFSHYQATTPAQQCAHEILFCDLTGQLRFDYMNAKLNELLCLFEAHCVKMRDEKTSSPYRMSQENKDALFKVRANILQSPGDNLKIATLANEAGISQNKLIALFKTFFGESIHQFVVKARMERAKQLLETSDIQIMEICKMVGYSDQSGFSRAFRKTYGVVPSQIRH